MRISDFVGWELDAYRKECNFTEDERRVFDMLAQDWSMKRIWLELPCSEGKATQLRRTIERKIIKVSARIS